MSDRLTYVMLLADNLNNSTVSELLGKHLKKHPIGLIYLDIKRFGEMERKYGQRICDRILQLFKQLIIEKENMATTGLLSYRMLGDDVFLFVQLEADQTVQMKTRLSNLAKELRLYLQVKLNEFMLVPGEQIELYVGTGLLDSQSKRKPDALLYNAIKESIHEAKNEADFEYTIKRTEFQDIVERKGISSCYQPIVSLSTGEIYGYEGLTRGPKESYFVEPPRLFDFADKEGQLFQMEQIAREKVIFGFLPLNKGNKLFININANVMYDPQFTPGKTLLLLDQMNLTPQQVVLEITERQSIDDFAGFTKVLDHYRKQGYRIAIDDAGAGYSSLQAIAELRPDFIKIDRSIICNIDRDKTKEILLETLTGFAKKMNCYIIAEGIETIEEMRKVIDLGVHFGQGFFLGRPKPELLSVEKEALEVIHSQQRSESILSDSSFTVGDIAKPVKTFKENTYVSEIVDYFRQFANELGVVIVREDQPIGLVMREKLFQSLASQYGVPLYWRRSIRKLMDGYPLVLEEKVAVETASQLAMSRDQFRIYDFVLVTHEGKLCGVVTIQSILDTITKAKIENARDSNPLTGLPGNRRIEQELINRIHSEEKFSIIYTDLDFFKYFNDRFGFRKGDQILRFTSDLLKQVVLHQQISGDFIGHIGGDDFIIITSHENPVEICEEIIARFDKEIQSFYDKDLYVEKKKGEGEDPFLMRDLRKPSSAVKGISISLALLNCYQGETVCLSLESIAKRAGYLKKLAKNQLGSVFVQGTCES